MVFIKSANKKILNHTKNTFLELGTVEKNCTLKQKIKTEHCCFFLSSSFHYASLRKAKVDIIHDIFNVISCLIYFLFIEKYYLPIKFTGWLIWPPVDTHVRQKSFHAKEICAIKFRMNSKECMNLSDGKKNSQKKKKIKFDETI